MKCMTSRDNRTSELPLFLLLGTLGTALYATCTNTNRATGGPIPVKAGEFKPDGASIGPIYSERDVPSGSCSLYTRLAAENLFKITYAPADAWKIRDLPGIDEIAVDSKEDLENMAKNGLMKNGDRVGLYYPNSKYNNESRSYTHVAIYVGMENGKLYFADKFGKKTRTKQSIDELLDNGNLQPKEILFPSRD